MRTKGPEGCTTRPLVVLGVAMPHEPRIGVPSGVAMSIAAAFGGEVAVTAVAPWVQQMARRATVAGSGAGRQRGSPSSTWLGFVVHRFAWIRDCV
jgi:hypothetical protein